MSDPALQLLASLRLNDSASMQDQVRHHVRQLALSGQLAPGTQLPSTHRLAELWDVHLQTIQLALTPLVREGLLQRVNRVGTFVRPRLAQLTEVGIYYPEDVWTQGGSQFLQALHAVLKGELAATGVTTDVWIDPRPKAAAVSPWEPFVTAAHRREFQAVIVPQTDWPHIRWLDALSVPIAHFSTANRPNCVGVDHAAFFESALDALLRQGCRAVGLVPAYDPRGQNLDGTPTAYARAMTAFVDLARDRGLTLRNEWICQPTGHAPTQAAAKQFGYESVQRLWCQSHRPDGLIVTDDVAATGVIAALLERGVKDSGAMKLALYKNSAVDIFCPVPATFVEFSTPAIAAALIAQVQQQFSGQPVAPVRLKPVLRPVPPMAVS